MMKKNGISSVSSSSFAKKVINRIKNSLKKPSKKTFGKIGLFLVFSVMILNITIGTHFKDKIKNNSKGVIIKMVPAVSALTLEEFLSFRQWAIDQNKNYQEKIDNQHKEIEDIGGPVTQAFRALLWGVLIVVHWLVLASAAMFDVVVTTSTNGTKNIFDVVVRENQAVYASWTMVRDLLNMFFMFILLFSAFATIFQVEKYHLRKTIIMLVVMALLVNFSFPISRVIIDFSNSLMYFLIDLIQQTSDNTASSRSVLISQMSNMGMLSEAMADKSAISALMLSIIFQFILFATLFAFALNLLIRILAFAILIILSPAGFVLSFFPSTKSMADSWWDNLFKYAIMGPVMIFFLLIANSMFNATGRQQLTIPNNSTDVGFIASSLLFTIPIVFLWIGLIASQKFGGAASASAMSFAKKTGSNISKYGQKAAWGTVAATGVPGAFKQRYADIKGGFDKSRENREARVASMLGSKDAMSNLERKRYEEDSKKMKNFNNSDLESKAKTGSVAAADELLNRKSLKQEVYEEAVKNSKDIKRNDDLTAKFKGANKENRMDIVASIDARRNANDETKIAPLVSGGSTRDQAMKKLLEDEIKSKFTKLNHTDFAKQDFEKIYAEIGNKLSKATGSLEHHEGMVMRDSINQAFSGLDPDGRDEIRKNLSSSQLTALGRAGVV